MISTHDLRGIRRAARKHMRRLNHEAFPLASDPVVTLNRMTVARDLWHIERERAERASRELADRLNLPWYP